jgi:predicted alpha/beta superfamily hydrolase
MSLRGVALAFLVSGLALAAPAMAQTIVSESAYQPEGVKQFVIRSEKLGRDMLVVVSAPTSGSAVMPGQRAARDKLPAVYALDMGWGVAGPVGQLMSSVTAMSATYVISVGYPAANWRETDFMFDPFTERGRTVGGGGAKYLAFLTEELQPFLEQRYPLDPDRAVLFGHSLGGLFTANVLARQPEAFGGYIIASPSVKYDTTLVQRVAKAAPAGKGRRVFVSAGEKEGYDIPEGATAIAAALSAPGSTFKTEKRIYANEGHISYYARLTPEAFASVLPPAVKFDAAVTLPREALERVTGVYDFADKRTMTVLMKDGKLFAQMTGIMGEAPILPDNESRFFIPGYETTIIFDLAQPGPASALAVKANGVEMRATRK